MKFSPFCNILFCKIPTKQPCVPIKPYGLARGEWPSATLLPTNRIPHYEFNHVLLYGCLFRFQSGMQLGQEPPPCVVVTLGRNEQGEFPNRIVRDSPGTTYCPETRSSISSAAQ